MTTDAIEVRDTAAIVAQPEGGVMALAYMDEPEFERRLTALKLGQDRVRRIQRELMIGPTQDNPEGEDYGIIPGTKKPALLKPGAEKLCNVYGLVGTYELETILGDGVTTPPLRVTAVCWLHRGSADGPVVGEGRGAANSWETKHRYRQAQRACPGCGAETLRRSKDPGPDGERGWFCWAKIGGCGKQFPGNTPAILEQHAGKVDNPDPWDAENTLTKMAKKRAFVDATLTTTATSGLFTQDIEDAPPQEPRQAPPPASASQQAAVVATVTRQAQAVTGDAPAPAPPGERPLCCPRCGKRSPIIADKYRGGWTCWTKSTKAEGGGCGYHFDAADVAIHESREPGAEG